MNRGNKFIFIFLYIYIYIYIQLINSDLVIKINYFIILI